MAVNPEDSLQGDKQSSSPHFLMKCQTSEEWKTVVSTLQNLTEEASFDVDSRGVRFRAMDPSHIALIDLVWEAGGFEKFEFHGKEGERRQVCGASRRFCKDNQAGRQER